MSKKLKIGLFGFGVIGQGLHDIIRSQNLNLEVVKIAIKNPEKKRTLEAHLFTTSHDEILENLKKFEVPLLEPKNPYWRDKGVCFEDCDHYKIIISKERIQ